MGQAKRIKVFSDGAARGNPGPAAIAYSIYDESGTCIDSGARLIGRATNNEAEYQALLLAMDRAREHCRDIAHFFLDSELVVKQVNGKYRARDERMRDYLSEVLSKMKCFRIVRVVHVPRENERTQLVDRMVNETLDRAG
jgi:ribonuclease HI